MIFHHHLSTYIHVIFVSISISVSVSVSILEFVLLFMDFVCTTFRVLVCDYDE